MVQRVLFTIGLFMLFAAPVVHGQQSTDKIRQKVMQSRSVEAGVPTNPEELSQDKQGLIQEVLDAKYRLILLKYRQEKTQRYIASAKQSIEDLEYEKEELKKLQTQLKPYLKGVVSRLENFIAQDLPFLPDERSKRVITLYNYLDNPDTRMSKLLQAVFEEGLEIETEYGKVMDAAEYETLNIGGVDTQVVIFRLGRVAMYYLSQDGTKTGFYNRVTKNWEPLPQSMNQEIRLAVKTGKRERTAAVLTLPLEMVK